MEVDDIQTPQPASKYSRVNSNGKINSSKITPIHIDDKSEVQRVAPTGATAVSVTPVATNGGDAVVGTNRLRQWQHSSRIIRVSRASGGKDRHSKVWTAKGPRDRRVRLSVTTAIQFYDLQDRLGYDQPSKAVEWLIKAAADAINELPSLNSSNFPPETPRRPSDEGRAGNVVDSGDPEIDVDPGLGQNQVGSMSKSGCSSNNSETSKGSGLSLSRSEIRVKARERARERTAKEKEREIEPQQQSSRVNVNFGQHHQQHHHQNVSSIAPTSSFTQLLTAGISNLNESNTAVSSSSPAHHGTRGVNQWLSSTSTTPMDYFGGTTQATQIQLAGISYPSVMTISPFSVGLSEAHHHHHQQQQANTTSHHEQLHHQHFPFIADPQLLQAAAGAGGGGGSDYTLNFSIASSSTASSGGLQLGAAGFSNNSNRGTLQSNSPSLLPYLQRFSATDGSSVPFFLGGAAVENHHHHQQQHFQPPGLHLCYSDGGRQSDQKGKSKN